MNSLRSTLLSRAFKNWIKLFLPKSVLRVAPQSSATPTWHLPWPLYGQVDAFRECWLRAPAKPWKKDRGTADCTVCPRQEKHTGRHWKIDQGSGFYGINYEDYKDPERGKKMAEGRSHRELQDGELLWTMGKIWIEGHSEGKSITKVG